MSGKERKFALIYQRQCGDYVIVAFKGGSDAQPGWYLNLVDNPEVEVQVLADQFPARARTADNVERAELWPTMTDVWPDYDNYQEKTDRQIPIVILERMASEAA